MRELEGMNCRELEKLVDSLHEKTRFDDLEDGEFVRIFPEIEKAYKRGEVLLLVKVLNSEDYNKNFRYKKIRTIYRERCE